MNNPGLGCSRRRPLSTIAGEISTAVDTKRLTLQNRKMEANHSVTKIAGPVTVCILAALPWLLGACTGTLKPTGLNEDTSEQTDTAKEIGMPKETQSTQGSSSAASDSTAAENEIASFGAGCFWCVEAVFQQLDGVVEVSSGYMNGTVPDPTYQQVCSGTTGHAEVVQVTFDPKRISFEDLLGSFWKLHDPTTLNRPGSDAGTQYRSAIFYHSEAQRGAAEKSKKAADASGAFTSAIVTEITKAGPYYKAEGYHQDSYRLNKQQPYCRAVIAPKLEKLGMEH